MKPKRKAVLLCRRKYADRESVFPPTASLFPPVIPASPGHPINLLKSAMGRQSSSTVLTDDALTFLFIQFFATIAAIADVTSVACLHFRHSFFDYGIVLLSLNIIAYFPFRISHKFHHIFVQSAV